MHTRQDPPNHTLLIADDEDSIRMLVTMTLSTERYTLLEAADGEEAWDLVQRHRPRVVLLDVQMPRRTGLDLARSIRADPGLRDVTVIMLTAKDRPADISAGRAAGAKWYLTKPFSPLELLMLVNKEMAAP